MTLKFKRVFTTAFDSAYKDIKFKTIKAEIKNKDGTFALKMDQVIVPENWSNNAANIMARNYFRKKGVPVSLEKVEEYDVPTWLQRSVIHSDLDEFDEKNYCNESDARQVIDRIVGAWTYWGVKGGYFNAKEAEIFYDELRYMLINQMAAPNSPQWFNTGLHWAYGIQGSPQGHYYFDEALKMIQKSGSAYERPQPHACFILSVEDDLVGPNGIMALWQKEALLFKYGSGTGSNFSNIRSSGEKLSGGGYSSGLMSFLRIGDVAGGSIKSGGTTRRAAKMVVVNVNHPEIIEFIQWKNKEEEKVMDLTVGSKLIKFHINNIVKAYREQSNLKEVILTAIEHGVTSNYIVRVLNIIKNNEDYEKKIYEINWDSDVYLSIFGQNSNNSVRVDDAFMESVLKNENYDLLGQDKQVLKSIKARCIWKEIGKAVWGCADPGLQFDTTINAWNTCATSGRINASNPCSEYMFLDNTACNLASLNLIKFTNDNQFLVDKFKHAVSLWTLVLEVSIYMAHFPSEQIALLSYKFRTLGLGYGNLGALLTQQAIAYDSEKACNTAAAITALMQGVCYETSALIAQKLGPFEEFDKNKKDMMKVMRNHRAAALNEQTEGLNTEIHKLNQEFCVFPEIVKDISALWDNVIALGDKFGYRNAQVSVIAPTGTIGIVMDFKTYGIEPLYAQIINKQLSGGGYMQFVNDEVSIALKKLQYNDKEIKDIENYMIGYKKISNAMINKLIEIGLNINDIEFINNNINNAFNIEQVFKLSQDQYEKLNIPQDTYKQKNFNFLNYYNISADLIKQENVHIFGNMTIENAPHLKTEHLNIFDCAVPSGNGVRSLNYKSHINIMAAVQPFLSGAISKTVNLPNSATIDECLSAYIYAWKNGIKAIALYRDGSKFAQVLNNKSLDQEIDQFIAKDRGVVHEKTYGNAGNVSIHGIPLWYIVNNDENGVPRNIMINFAKEGSPLRAWASAWCAILSMYLKEKGFEAVLKTYRAFKYSKFEPMGKVSGHESIKTVSSVLDFIVQDLVLKYPQALNLEIPSNNLPTQRDGKINKIKIGQETLYIIVGELDNRPVEIFVAGMGNEGSDLKGWMNSCAKLMSLYLQDCPDIAIYNIVETFEGTTFSPNGMVRGYENIKFTSSPLDFLARYLKSNYSSMFMKQTNLLYEDKINYEYKTGQECRECKSFKLKYNGNCYVCENCGTTTGCS